MLSCSAEESILILVRHGETIWNADGRIQGQLDIPLNDVGRQQASNLAKEFERCGFSSQVDAVVASDLQRASETAQLILHTCPKVEGHPHLNKDLREFHFGQRQGLLRTEETADMVQVQAEWKKGNFSARVPDGESVEDVITRGLRGLSTAASLGRCVLVVAHGGLLKWCAIAIECGGLQTLASATPESTFHTANVQSVLRAPVTNCCCSVVRYNRQTDTWSCDRWFEEMGAEQALDDTG